MSGCSSVTGACGSAAMLADPDNLPTLRASAAQLHYFGTITSVIQYCTGGLGIEENRAVLGTDCTVRSTLSGNVEGYKLAGGSYEDTMNASSRVPAKKEKKASCGFIMDEVDVWVVLHGRAFNVPNFLSQHLGGELAILTTAGKDATVEFDMIHPPDVAKKYAPDAVIGTLGDGGEDDDDEEDDSSEGSYTVEEVAKDNKKGDVWVVLNGRVLNVSNFLSQHLGGESAILTPAGKDAAAECST